MNKLEEDKRIAAASLLALVSSENRGSPIPSAIPDEQDRITATKSVGTLEVVTSSTAKKEKCRVNRKEMTSPSDFSSSKKSEEIVQQPPKVSDDESSPQRKVPHRSSFSKKREVSRSRRHSYPVAATTGSSNDTTSSDFSRTRKTSKTPELPQLLMKALTNIDYSDTMTFLPDNNNFIIIKNERFSEDIMPNDFNMTKFGCFLNKLGQYGFIHSMLENSRHLFSHPYFRKNCWDLLQFINDTSLITDSSSLPSSSPSPLNQTPYNTEQRTITRKRKPEHSPDYTLANHQAKYQKTWQQNELPIQAISTNSADIFQSSLTQQLKISRQLEERMILNSLHGNASLPLSSSTLPQSSASTSTNLSSLDSHLSMMSNMFSVQNNQDVQNVTKDVVAKAIDCLLHDENHTLDLIARRGGEIHSRRLSLPGLSTSTFSNSWGGSGGLHHLSQSSGMNFIP